eukprot:CAMPEP_0175130378 /NCGR_PEP_ID=MMETSP0087-20121206/5975_1 /TAXON_ID=136419 /ORGANISM="Unknown Unknown, Strain D1" /LENGTH=670 /DNA_ID=CAMNT_0016412593 /DNA_START=20 /DNA_END=2032 /DNA_ORIENTATION=+
MLVFFYAASVAVAHQGSAPHSALPVDASPRNPFSFAPAAPNSSAEPKYFGFYGASLNDTHTFSNLFQTDSLDLAKTAFSLGQRSLLHVGSSFFHKKGLRPDWKTAWAQTAAEMAPFVGEGRPLLGFNLGDELVWNCLEPSAVATAASAIRASFPRGSAIIWYNEAAILAHNPIKDSCGTPHPDFKIPDALDWFSVDIYHMDGEVDGWVDKYVKSYYETWIFPNLTASQQVMLVPGAFGSNVNHYPNGTYVCDKSCYDNMCTHDASDYLAWAQQDSRVAAVMPWNWDGCPACNGSHWTPPHTCCMDEIGAKDMPLQRVQWPAVGRALIGKSNEPREVADVPTAPGMYSIELSTPATTHFTKIATDYKQEIQELIKYFLNSYHIPDFVLPLVNKIGASIDDYVQQPFADEMRGISSASGVGLGEILLMNFIYDITAGCTSIVSQDVNGQIFHSRNLDYAFPGYLRNLTIQVDFLERGSVSYRGTTYAGYVGLLTGMRPNSFTVSIDERDAGHFWENFLEMFFNKKAGAMSFLIREVLAAPNVTYAAAVERYSTTPLIAPVYIIVGGTKPGEGAIITRNQTQAVDVWSLGQGPDASNFWRLETNYDHWKPPPTKDDRRDPGNAAMKAMGNADITKPKLFDVMSTPKVLNSGTTYTVVMSATEPDLYQTWIRHT